VHIGQRVRPVTIGIGRARQQAVEVLYEARFAEASVGAKDDNLWLAPSRVFPGSGEKPKISKPPGRRELMKSLGVQVRNDRASES
jgi:hypothetical protein